MIEMPTAANPAVVLLGDSYQVLKRMADGAVDHTISDPPYSETTHAGARSNKGAIGSVTIDFSSMTTEAFVVLCQELCRVSKRWVIMTCDWRHAAVIEDRLPDQFVRLGVWIKPNGMPQMTGDRPATGWEAVLIMHRKGKKRWNRGGHHAVWTYNKPNNGKHPTAKPLALIRHWIRDFTDPDETVLDPFCGSGTTAMACLYEGRRCLTVEQDPKYHKVAAARVAKLTAGDCLLPYVPRKADEDETLL